MKSKCIQPFRFPRVKLFLHVLLVNVIISFSLEALASECPKCDCAIPAGEIHKPRIILDQGYKETNSGIEGSVVMELKLNDQITKVNLPVVGNSCVQKVCQFFGYKKGSVKNNKMYDHQDRIFSIKKDKNCQKILSKIAYSNIELSTEQTKTIENCIKPYNGDHLVVSCWSKLAMSTSMSYHSNSDGSSICPIGFSKRSNDRTEDYPKNSFCLPNRCSCENGMAAISSYEFMGSICGVTLENESIEEEWSTNEQWSADETWSTEEENGERRSIDNVDSHPLQRLVIGQDTTPTKWPFQVMLFKDITTDDPHCSSAILSPKFLVTVGHCLTVESDSILINLNTLSEVYALANSELDGKIPSEQLILHPKYYNADTQTIENDIGLVYLSAAIFFNHEYRPICIHNIPVSDMSDKDIATFTVVGHGGSKILREANFTILDNDACADILKVPEDPNSYDSQYDQSQKTLTMDNKICAASTHDLTTGTCKGDSGAPLMFEIQDIVLGSFVSKFNLIGLVSLGSNECSDKPSPTVFIELYNYQEWIENAIKNIEKAYSGRYCVGDLTKQCASCDVSYKLEGVNCAQEFTQNQMSSLYDFFDDTFCASNCFEFMNIKPIEEKVVSGNWTIDDLANIFTAEYKKCKCENGQPSLRCTDDTIEYCDPQGCFDNYAFNLETNSCVIKKIDIASTCTNTEHYVEETDTCEPNICYCNLGEPSQNCFEHGLHICKPSSCVSGTEPIEVGKGSLCVKKCSKILEMDSTWFKPNPDLNVYWQIMAGDKYNHGYTFFDAMNYCKHLGSYVSLPTDPELLLQGLNDIELNDWTWIGLSKFGDIPDDLLYQLPSASAPFKWDRNRGYFSAGSVMNNIDVNVNNTLAECVEIARNDTTIIARSVDCNKRQNSFICEYSLSSLEKSTTLHQHYLDHHPELYNIDPLYFKNDTTENTYEEFYFEDYQFRLYGQNTSWADASDICGKEGFYLAEIKELRILNKIRNFIGDDKHFYIGGKSPPTKGKKCLDHSKYMWEHSGKPVLETSKLSAGSGKGCCMKINGKENLYTLGPCSEEHKFLCQRNVPRQPQPYCTLCSSEERATTPYFWNDSTCQASPLDNNVTPIDLQEDYWRSQTICRCQNFNNELRYGLDCNESSCSYVHDAESIRSMSFKISNIQHLNETTFIVTRDKTKHVETESAESIWTCTSSMSWKNCLAYYDYSSNDDFYPGLISRNFRYNQNLDDHMVLAKDFMNYRYTEHLDLYPFWGKNYRIPLYILYGMTNLKVISVGVFSKENLDISTFIFTNKKLEVINFWNTDLDVIEENAFDAVNLKSLRIYQSHLKAIPESTFQFQKNLIHLMLAVNHLEDVDSSTFKNLKKLEILTLNGNNGTVHAESEDERDACGCHVFVGCFLPDFVRRDHDKVPTCSLQFNCGVGFTKIVSSDGFSNFTTCVEEEEEQQGLQEEPLFALSETLIISDSINHASSCSIGYHLEINNNTRTCVQNTCYCANGSPNGSANNTTCLSHNNHECASCNTGFTEQVFNNFTTCVEIPCQKNIDNCLICSESSNNICETCARYYSPQTKEDDEVSELNNSTDSGLSLKLSRNFCQKNVCTCHGGTPTNDCEVDGTEHCVACDGINVFIEEKHICYVPGEGLKKMMIREIHSWGSVYWKKIKEIINRIKTTYGETKLLRRNT